MKNLFSPLFVVLLLFVCHQTNAQIDYGTIKLMNSVVDTAILDISNGATYDLTIIGDSLNIMAVEPSGAAVESVEFLTSINENRVESTPPYLFKGDTSGDYWSWSTLPNYLDTPISFTVNYYDANSGGGTKLGDDIFTITFTKSETDPPSAPNNLQTGSITSNSIELTWTASTDASGIKEYRIYVQTDGSGTYDYHSTSTGAGTTYTVTGLSAATQYDFKVSAVDDSPSMIESGLSAASGSVTTQASSGGGYWTQTGNDVYYNSGNVGIGTTDIGTWRLAVEGKIRAREIKVDSDTWPDYVFEDDYELRTLKELQSYISEKGHLPNIPSARDVEVNGFELGEMNRLLLEKIEELTLYTISQQKVLEQKTDEILLLEKRIEALEKPHIIRK